MTGLLLDTGCFAMVLTDDPRLPDRTRTAIATADRVVLSAVSLYEIGQKVRLGTWPAMTPFLQGLADRARADGLDLMPLKPEAALLAATLDWSHRDPFDRMLAAVCRTENIPLLSPDTVFEEIGVARLWS